MAAIGIESKYKIDIYTREWLVIVSRYVLDSVATSVLFERDVMG